MKAYAFVLLLSVICVLSATGTRAEAPIVAPTPEECQAYTVVNLSQRTRFPSRDSPSEEWVLWCEGCRGVYPNWTLQAVFSCRVPGERDFRTMSNRYCPPDQCGRIEEIWLCPTWDSRTGRRGEVRTSCQCCLGCTVCALESRLPRFDRHLPVTISHGQ